MVNTIMNITLRAFFMATDLVALIYYTQQNPFWLGSKNKEVRNKHRTSFN